MMQQFENVQDKALSIVEPVREFGRKSFYFGLGTVGMAFDGAKNVYAKSEEYSGKLVERGEKVATNTRERVDGMTEEPQAFVSDTVKKAGDTFGKYSEQVLTRVHIPTSEDLETVSKKVSAMDRKLDKAIKEAKPATKSTPKSTAKTTVNGTKEAVAVDSI